MNWQAISSHTQNKRVDGLRDSMNKRFVSVNKRFDNIDRWLEEIEIKLDNHTERIARLEGPPLVHARD